MMEEYDGLDYNAYALERIAETDWTPRLLSEEVPQMVVLGIEKDTSRSIYIVMVKYVEELEDNEYLGWFINIPVTNIEGLMVSHNLTEAKALSAYLVLMDEARTIDLTTLAEPPTNEDSSELIGDL